MSSKSVVIFEDSTASNFNPLAYTRPVFELISGMTTLWENIVNRFYPDAEVGFVCREYLKASFQQRVNGKVNELEAFEEPLFINGRVLAAFSELPSIGGDSEIGIQDGVIVYARLKAKDVKALAGSISDDTNDFSKKLASLGLPEKEVKGMELANYLWELVLRNEEGPEKNPIEADFKFYADPKKSKGIIEKGAYIRASVEGEIKVYDAEEATKLMLSGELPLYVGEGARVMPNVLVDVTGGPVYIGVHADIRPPTIIDGPCCIMDSAGTSKKVTIIDGAKIRPGVTMGPVCRIGGEVEATIIQGYSNKHHSGFIGHTYMGEWVNIGAMATNSDLKNDLSDVKVPVNGQLVDTKELKVGSFIGDHVKLGIGALLTTGTSVGIMTNVLASGSIPPQDIPSYCFYREDRFSKGFRPRTVIATAGAVMARRKVEQTPEYAEMLEKVYEMIKDSRDEEIEKHNRRVDNALVRIVRKA